MTRRRGFTLVELLAVIIILAIILVIAVPKVMTIISDSKKATLESTARMIASSAEKAKVQNGVFGKDTVISCESVAKLNNNEYEFCSVIFEDDIAKVTIKGKGKFDGINVCSGTKINSKSSNEECSLPSTVYIESLLAQESILHNGLVQTTANVNGKSVDAGIRYVGEIPNNKIYFNCKDKDSKNVVYGEKTYNYGGSCEIWKIIGVFDTKSTNSETETSVKRVKIVRDSLPKTVSWDSSSDGSNEGETAVNNGGGVNQWGEVKDSNGNITYEGSDLMRLLNGYYIGGEDTCKYCNDSNQKSCENICSNIVPLSTTSLKMVDDVLWNLGATTYNTTVPLSTMYSGERSGQTGKTCTSGDSCNDNVARTTTWIGKVGLIYPSDYAYASTDEACADDIFGEESTCKVNNWLHLSSGYYWTISPCIKPNNADFVYSISSKYNLSNYNSYITYFVRPALYLSTDVEIIGGDGNEVPYKLRVNKE